jgi:hypothetical protein
MNWRELAAAALSEQADAQQAPALPEAELIRLGLTEDLARKLLWMETASVPPCIGRRDAWRLAVDDALSLARSGWAGKAIGLGWANYDLFGVGAKTEDDFAGLAVWLKGRRLVLLDERGAIARQGDSRFYFNRGGFGHGRNERIGPVMLWDFGR